MVEKICRHGVYTVLIVVLLLGACGLGDKNIGVTEKNGVQGEPITKTEFLLDTVCTVTVFSEKDAAVAAEALTLCADYEKILSRTVAGSDISKLNAAGGRSVAVSESTRDLLKIAIEYGDLSKGLFDVSIGSVSELWDFSAKNETRVAQTATGRE